MTAMLTNRTIFIDTWAILALANRRDRYHKIAINAYNEIERREYHMVTSDYILDEVITSLFKNVNFDGAFQFVDALLSAVKMEQLDLQWVDESRFNSAWSLRGNYQDKPDISFTDLTSFVIMKELGVNKVFTGDQHFEMINFGFEIWPKNSPERV